MAQVSLNTRISYETYERLDEYTKDYRKSKASVVEKALQEYLDREEAKVKRNEKRL